MNPFRGDPLDRVEVLIPRVYAYVAYRLGHGPDAEDATSETIERALRYRGSYDSRKGPPIAWLIGIARRCIDQALFERREVAGAAATEQAAPGVLDEDVVRAMFVRQAVGRLGERERELVALRYGADLTARQIGELVGMKTNAVEVALHRALAQLRLELAPTGEAALATRTLEPAGGS